jgi:hypothetical protein
MSSFPNFSNIADFVTTALDARKGNTTNLSKLNCWVRAASAVTPILGKDTKTQEPNKFGNMGMVIYSNPDFKIFGAAGDKNIATIYGDNNHSGTVGVTWDGKGISAGVGLPGRPSPIITSFVVDEGSGNISRKAEFTIRCFTLEQLDVIAAHYLEPGFTVFLEWGWNLVSGLKNYNSTLDVDSVSKYQSFVEVNKKREATKGNADVFLGFITGGSIAISDAFWDVQIKATGYVELPAYFMAADTPLTKEEADKNETQQSLDFDSWDVVGDTDINTQRFKLAFNLLPSNKKTQLVKNLINDPEVANAINFINFDEAITDSVNSKTVGHWYNPFKDTKVKAGDKKVAVADGTKLIGPEKFIRFGTLMKIMNTIAVKAYKVGNHDVKYQIYTGNTPISAFENIFSTDKTKLFIPNATSPTIDFASAFNKDAAVSVSGTTNNSVKYGQYSIEFPSLGPIIGGRAEAAIIKMDVFNNIDLTYVNNNTNSKIEGIDKKAFQWGYLDNLYVNFDFAKGILDTKNFLIKDALYQILNGISSAAGGMWDFQIVESVAGKENKSDNNAPKEGTTILKVVDMNFVSDTEVKKTKEIYQFYLQGADSIFMEANFDMDIGGAIMNQVIGSRLGSKQNNQLPPYQGKLFSDNQADLILKKVETDKQLGQAAQDANDKSIKHTTDKKDTKEQEQKDLAVFLNKIALYPKVEKTINNAEFGDDPYQSNYLGAFNDSQLFDSLRLKKSLEQLTNGNQTSILLPIKFTFTIHGVSGIKRGDKFRVHGLPAKYSTSGFFQVLSVKHILDGMLWKTEISGGFRQSRSK